MFSGRHSSGPFLTYLQQKFASRLPYGFLRERERNAPRAIDPTFSLSRCRMTAEDAYHLGVSILFRLFFFRVFFQRFSLSPRPESLSFTKGDARTRSTRKSNVISADVTATNRATGGTRTRCSTARQAHGHSPPLVLDWPLIRAETGVQTDVDLFHAFGRRFRHFPSIVSARACFSRRQRVSRIASALVRLSLSLASLFYPENQCT